MREIKFKAVCDNYDGTNVLCKVLKILWDKNEINVEFPDGSCEYYELQDIILIQSTGLLDKNNKKIFEGDIVRINNEDDDNCQSIDDITNISFLKGFISRNRPVEIIGNIYKHSELLEVKKCQDIQ